VTGYTTIKLACVGIFPLVVSLTFASEAIPTADELQSGGAIVGQITIERSNVFDTTKPGENKSLYRLANRWHIVTRDLVIRQQLLFESGEPYSKRLVAESERLLRQNAYLYDAKIEAVRLKDGVVDIRVKTRDVWTLTPGVSVSRSGGENRTRLTLSERNLLGRGISLRFNYVENVDRDSTSFQFFDRNLGRSWTSLFLGVADSSDGNTLDVRLVQPFFSLDTRRAAGVTYLDDTREVSFFELGNEVAEYATDTDFHTAFIGLSAGLQNGWTRRWTAGLVYDERRFSPVANGILPALLPADRKFVYPFIGFELLQDKFESTSNRDQIERTEDFFLGTRLWASIGYATTGFGSDRESLIYRIEASRGFGSIAKRALLLSSSVTGRVDDGNTSNSEISLNARFYDKLSDKRLFFVTLDAVYGQNLDLDNLTDLGGDTGLRGYPLRYQTGDSRVLFTVEKRYFTDWYPFRLIRVGGAVFADVGRVWGNNPVGGQRLGWLKNVGFGLRLVPTRASGRDVIHIDIAFPLDGDASIDSVQILFESKRSF